MHYYPRVEALADMFHHEVGRRGSAIHYIILHSTDGTNSVPWLTRTSVPPVSCHVLVARSGKRFRIVQDSNTAWHAGHGTVHKYAANRRINLNHASLGLELENLHATNEDYPLTQVESAAEQVVEWYAAHGYLPVIGHAAVDSRKRDLARFPWLQFHAFLGERCAYIFGERLSGERSGGL